VAVGGRGRRTPPATAALLIGLIATVGALLPAPARSAVGAIDGPSLVVTPVDALDPDGALVRARGSGFDTRVGIYVALCVLDGAGQDVPPSPCGGGADVQGTGGASVWISDTPPPYGVGLALPYGPDGSFDVELAVSGRIGDVDCRARSCGIVTRADHLRPTDRSQDVIVPVTFTATAGAGRTGLAGTLALLLAVLIGLAVRRARRITSLRTAPALALLLALTVVGCTPSSGVSTADPGLARDVPIVPLDVRPEPILPVTVRGDDGRDVVVTDVARVVPLVAGVAEIVQALGLGDLMVAREAGATFPELAGLPIVTDGHAVVAEAVLAVRPTLVLVDAATGPAEAVAQLRASGVPVVVVPQAWTLADVSPRIRAVADALGVAEAGERLVARTEAELDAAAELLPAIDPPPRIAFLYLRGSAGIQLLGGPGSGADALVARLGALDAGTAIGLDRAYTPITSEALIAARPDVIVVMRSGLASVDGIEGLVALPGVAQTPAGRARRVVAIDDALLLSFGPRTGAVLTILAEGIAAALDDPAQAVR